MTTKTNDDKQAAIARQIDENLRRVYQQAVEEQVPDRFTDLLRQLKEQDSRK